MAAKNNIRSIRFSDEMAELIDQQVGDTFTQKFENLVTRCVWELPAKEKQLADIQARIDQELERLYNLQQATKELRRLEEDIKFYFGLVERQARDIFETAKQDAQEA